MTHDEIEKKAAFLIDCLGDPPDHDYLTRMLCALVVQALGEAAQKVDSMRHQWPANAGQAQTAFDQAVYGIGKLAASLDAVPVSS